MDNIRRESLRPHPFIKLKNDAGTEDIHYSLFYEDIPSEFQVIAAKELNETEENKRKGLMKLKEFLKREGGDIADVDDNTLIIVLQNCKYNFKKSETKLKRFLEIRRMVTEKLQEADMERLENVLDHMVVSMLPYRDKHGRAICISAPNINFDLFDMDEVALFTFVCLLFLLSSPLTSISGTAHILECKTPSLSVLYPLLKAYRRHAMTALNLPIRVGRLDFINENAIIRWTYNLLRPILPSKVVERTSFNGSDIQNLQKHYHRDLLPEEFGGTLGPLSPKVYKEELLDFIERLKSKRLTKTIPDNAM